VAVQLVPIEAQEKTIGQIFSDAYAFEIPAYQRPYAPRWDEFLSKAKTSFIVLGCMDKDRAYAIPHDRISKLLPHLHRSGDRHWHLVLEENAAGQIELAIPKTGSKIGLTEFEVKINE
jgi:hypothetical protein